MEHNSKRPKVPAIKELERILDEEQPIEILPDGTVRGNEGEKKKRKPITLREPLGGEYS